MSTLYKKLEDVPTEALISRLLQLSQYIINVDNFVLSIAAKRLGDLTAKLEAAEIIEYVLEYGLHKTTANIVAALRERMIGGKKGE